MPASARHGRRAWPGSSSRSSSSRRRCWSARGLRPAWTRPASWSGSRRAARTPISIATLYLAPFAGIAFLWFIGVVRARIGDREDQLFSTVFLGSGLLFVAMYWAGAAQLVSLLGENRYDAAPALTAEDLEAARSEAFAFLFVLAARAAGVFMLVTSTIILRGRIMPKAIAYIGYLIALVMLLSVAALQWIVLLFPVWVLVVSVFVLLEDRLVGRTDKGPTVAPAA